MFGLVLCVGLVCIFIVEKYSVLSGFGNWIFIWMNVFGLMEDVCVEIYW